jgi:hypothetical protein
MLGAATKLGDGTLAFVIAICYLGAREDAEAAIKPVRAFAKPMVDMAAERPYLEMQSLFDKDIPPGKRYYNRAHNLRRLGNERVREAYAVNYARLVALKRAVDPTNFFRQNSNIPP